MMGAILGLLGECYWLLSDVGMQLHFTSRCFGIWVFQVSSIWNHRFFLYLSKVRTSAGPNKTPVRRMHISLRWVTKSIRRSVLSGARQSGARKGLASIRFIGIYSVLGEVAHPQAISLENGRTQIWYDKFGQVWSSDDGLSWFKPHRKSR